MEMNKDNIPAKLESMLLRVDFIDALAQEIRRLDGRHTLGAGALAEALAPFISETCGRMRQVSVDSATNNCGGDGLKCVAEDDESNDLDQNARQTPPFRAGKESAQRH